MLLVGNPGTGKTLTAEAIADNVRRPLYVLSAGELDRYAGDVENRLNTVLELAEKWNAVLLFDECDVFMQQRSNGQLDHNEIFCFPQVRCLPMSNDPNLLIVAQNSPILPWYPIHDVQPHRHNRPGLPLPNPSYPALSRSGPRRERTHLGAVCVVAAPDRLDERRMQTPLPAPHERTANKNALKIATLLAVQERTNVDIEHIRSGAGYGGG